ncbi:MAG: beta-lactamase family protein [Deltaproteobacteria bacterium]|nr:beta-lactamase family protein [Deltaproteobacteria bacterium]
MSGAPAGRLDARLADLLARGVEEGVFPSAGALIASEHRVRAVACAGGARLDSLWDLASLTKPMAVVTLCMRGVAAGWLSLDEVVPALPGAPVTVRALLAHRSGLPALCDLPAMLDRALGRWTPGSIEARRVALRLIAELPRAAPPQTIYSDLGFIVLADHLERRLGRPLRALIAGFSGTEPARHPERFVPGRLCPRRGRVLRGEVEDLNAWALGGAAGHAGLFATLEATGAWAIDLGRADAGLPASVPTGVVQRFWDLAERAPAGPDGVRPTWVLGFDTPTPGASSAGTTVSPHAVGHLGYTGTSVWLDREQRTTIVLLSNRSAGGPHTQAAMRAFRPRFHDAARALLAGR